jgi:hypothetical protein
MCDTWGRTWASSAREYPTLRIISCLKHDRVYDGRYRCVTALLLREPAAGHAAAPRTCYIRAVSLDERRPPVDPSGLTLARLEEARAPTPSSPPPGPYPRAGHRTVGPSTIIEVLGIVALIMRERGSADGSSPGWGWSDSGEPVLP